MKAFCSCHQSLCTFYIAGSKGEAVLKKLNEDLNQKILSSDKPAVAVVAGAEIIFSTLAMITYKQFSVQRERGSAASTVFAKLPQRQLIKT